ncbi:hypothetical protein SAMN04489729_3467 [Amycolatopsis lurida]|nr:hypothetical protein SAMN04489729_3467 [Amycolatopsis lurida]
MRRGVLHVLGVPPCTRLLAGKWRRSGREPGARTSPDTPSASPKIGNDPGPCGGSCPCAGLPPYTRLLAGKWRRSVRAPGLECPWPPVSFAEYRRPFGILASSPKIGNNPRLVRWGVLRVSGVPPCTRLLAGKWRRLVRAPGLECPWPPVSFAEYRRPFGILASSPKIGNNPGSCGGEFSVCWECRRTPASWPESGGPFGLLGLSVLGHPSVSPSTGGGRSESSHPRRQPPARAAGSPPYAGSAAAHPPPDRKPATARSGTWCWNAPGHPSASPKEPPTQQRVLQPPIHHPRPTKPGKATVARNRLPTQAPETPHPLGRPKAANCPAVSRSTNGTARYSPA